MNEKPSIRKVWSKEEEPNDGREALRDPLPSRLPRMTRDVAFDLERAISRCRHLGAKERDFLLCVLMHTDGNTHVCYRPREYLLEKSGVSDRWSRLLITRLHGPGWTKGERPKHDPEPGLILTRLVYARLNPGIRKGTPEYLEGCLFLRWEVTAGQEFDDRARRIEWAAVHSRPSPALHSRPRAAVEIPPSPALHSRPSPAVEIPPRAAVEIPPSPAVHSRPSPAVHSPPSICAFLKDLNDPSSSSSPSQEAAATGGQDSRHVTEAPSGIAPPQSGAHLRATPVVGTEPAGPEATAPEREAGEGGGASLGPAADAPEARVVQSREAVEAAVAWFEFRRRAMFPAMPPRTPIGVEVRPYFSALIFLLDSGMSPDLQTAAAHLQWVVWASHKSHKNSEASYRNWSVPALLKPKVIVWALDFARGRGKNVDRPPGDHTVTPERPSRPAAPSEPRGAPSRDQIDAMIRAGLPVAAHLATPEHIARVLRENDGKKAAE